MEISCIADSNPPTIVIKEHETSNPNHVQSTNINVNVTEKPDVPLCERTMHWMFYLTFVPCIRNARKWLVYTIPIVTNMILGSASLCLLYYPGYYPTQGFVWTTDMGIIWIAHNYLYYLCKHWGNAGCYENVQISKRIYIVSLIFYGFYLCYWAYFTIIQFYVHQDTILMQFGNLLMSSAWFIFFCTISFCYFFICIKLAQRKMGIYMWMKQLKHNKNTPIDEFYITYNLHYAYIRQLAKSWNILILIGLLLLSTHIPIDLISIIYNQFYYDIFGFVIKTLSLLWYLFRICDLNDSEGLLIAYLYKHRIYTIDIIKEIETYATYRSLGLNFYGIKVNRSTVIKSIVIFANLLLPTLYALVSNKVLE